MLNEGTAALASIFASYENASETDRPLEELQVANEDAGAILAAMDGLLKKSTTTKVKSAAALLKLVKEHAIDGELNNAFLNQFLSRFSFSFTTVSESLDTSIAMMVDLIKTAAIFLEQCPKKAMTHLPQLASVLITCEHHHSHEISSLAKSVLTRYFSEATPGGLDKKLKLLKAIRLCYFGRYERMMSMTQDRKPREDDLRSAFELLASGCLRALSYTTLFCISNGSRCPGLVEDWNVSVSEVASKPFAPWNFVNAESSETLAAAALDASTVFVQWFSSLHADFPIEAPSETNTVQKAPERHRLPSRLARLSSKLSVTDRTLVLMARCRLQIACLSYDAEAVIANPKAKSTLPRNICMIAAKSALERDAKPITLLVEVFAALTRIWGTLRVERRFYLPCTSDDDPFSTALIRSILLGLYPGYHIDRLSCAHGRLVGNPMALFRKCDQSENQAHMLKCVATLSKQDDPCNPVVRWPFLLWEESTSGIINKGLSEPIPSLLPSACDLTISSSAVAEYVRQVLADLTETQLALSPLAEDIEAFLMQVIPGGFSLPGIDDIANAFFDCNSNLKDRVLSIGQTWISQIGEQGLQEDAIKTQIVCLRISSNISGIGISEVAAAVAKLITSIEQAPAISLAHRIALFKSLIEMNIALPETRESHTLWNLVYLANVPESIGVELLVPHLKDIAMRCNAADEVPDLTRIIRQVMKKAVLEEAFNIDYLTDLTSAHKILIPLGLGPYVAEHHLILEKNKNSIAQHIFLQYSLCEPLAVPLLGITDENRLEALECLWSGVKNGLNGDLGLSSQAAPLLVRINQIQPLNEPSFLHIWRKVGTPCVQGGVDSYPKALDRLLTALFEFQELMPDRQTSKANGSDLILAMEIGLNFLVRQHVKNTWLIEAIVQWLSDECEDCELEPDMLMKIWPDATLWENPSHVFNIFQIYVQSTRLVPKKIEVPFRSLKTLAEWKSEWTSQPLELASLVFWLHMNPDLSGQQQEGRRIILDLLTVDGLHVSKEIVILRAEASLRLIHSINFWSSTTPNLVQKLISFIQDSVQTDWKDELLSRIGFCLEKCIVPWFSSSLAEATVEMEASTAAIALESCSLLISPLCQFIDIAKGAGKTSGWFLFDSALALLIQQLGALIQAFAHVYFESILDEVTRSRDFLLHFKGLIRRLAEYFVDLEILLYIPSFHNSLFDALLSVPWLDVPMMDWLPVPQPALNPLDCPLDQSATQFFHSHLQSLLVETPQVTGDTQDGLLACLSLIFGRHLSVGFVQALVATAGDNGNSLDLLNMQTIEIVVKATGIDLSAPPKLDLPAPNVKFSPLLSRAFRFFNRPETLVQHLLIRPRNRLPSRAAVNVINSIVPQPLSGYVCAQYDGPSSNAIQSALMRAVEIWCRFPEADGQHSDVLSKATRWLSEMRMDLVPFLENPTEKDDIVSSIGLKNASQRVMMKILQHYPDSFRVVTEELLNREAKGMVCRFLEAEAISSMAKSLIVDQAQVLESLFSSEMNIQLDGTNLTFKLWDASREVRLTAKLNVHIKQYPCRIPQVIIGENTQAASAVKPASVRTWTVCMTRILKGPLMHDEEQIGDLLWLAGGTTNVVYAVAQLADIFRNYFADAKECLICYSILHRVSQTVPKRECGSCGNYFHSECLQKWYQTSHNTKCPLCRCVL